MNRDGQPQSRLHEHELPAADPGKAPFPRRSGTRHHALIRIRHDESGALPLSRRPVPRAQPLAAVQKDSAAFFSRPTSKT